VGFKPLPLGQLSQTILELGTIFGCHDLFHYSLGKVPVATLSEEVQAELVRAFRDMRGPTATASSAAEPLPALTILC